jgi:hypothetical protein
MVNAEFPTQDAKGLVIVRVEGGEDSGKKTRLWETEILQNPRHRTIPKMQL